MAYQRLFREGLQHRLVVNKNRNSENITKGFHLIGYGSMNKLDPKKDLPFLDGSNFTHNYIFNDLINCIERNKIKSIIIKKTSLKDIKLSRKVFMEKKFKVK